MKKFPFLRKSFLWTLIILSCVSFAIGCFFSIFQVRLNKALAHLIADWGQTHYSVQLCSKEIGLSLFPMALHFRHLNLKPKNPNVLEKKSQEKIKDKKSFHLQSLFIRKLRILFKPWSIFRGWKHIFQLEIIGLKAETTSQSQSKKEIMVSFLPFIRSLPFPDISFKKSDLKMTFPSSSLEMKIKNLDFFISYFPHSSMRSELNLKRSDWEIIRKKKTSLKNTSEKNFSFKMKAQAVFSKSGVQINKIQLNKKESFLLGKGFLGAPWSLSSWEKNVFQFSSDSYFKGEDLYPIFLFFFNDKKMPSLKGEIKMKSEIKKVASLEPQFKFQVEAKNVFLSHVKLGEASFMLDWKKGEKAINLISMKIKQEAGLLEMKKTRFSLSAPFRFHSLVRLKNFRLNPLLINLNLIKTPQKALPLYLNAGAFGICDGRLFPFPFISCKGHTSISEFSVKNPRSSETVFKIKKILGSGQVQISHKSVFYDTDLKRQTSYLRSVGEISYKKGFRIFYRGRSKDLTNMELLKLKMRGKSEFKGIVYGNRTYAIVDSNIQVKKFWLNDFELNRADFRLYYKKRKLNFKNVHVWKGSSFYRGRFNIGLKQKNIFLHFRSSKWEIFDVFDSIKHHFKFPFQVLGKGSAELKLWGPLKLNRLNYNFEAFIERGSIREESFLDFHVLLNSKKDSIKIFSLFLRKESGQMHLTGNLSNDWKIKALLSGHELLIEEFNFLKNFPLNGTLNFKSSLRGSLFSPEIISECQFLDSSIYQRNIEDSHFKFSISNKSFHMKGSFMGEKLKTSFEIPFHLSHPFYFFLKASNFNAAEIFALFPFFNHYSDLKTNISGVLDLKSEKGGFWNSTGRLHFDQFKLAEGAVSVRSEDKPLVLHVKDGAMDTDFELSGSGGFFHFSSKKSKKENLNLFLKTKLKMKILSFLFKNFEDLNGDFSSSLKILGPYNRPQVFGSAFLKEGYGKLGQTDFVFEKLESDILFDHKNVLVNFFKGKIGGGSFFLSGKIGHLMRGEDMTLNLEGNFKDIGFDFNGLKTKGSGDLSVKGDRRPYTLSGIYELSEGSLKKDFSDSLNPNSRKKKVSSVFQQKRRPLFDLDFDFHIKKKKPIPVEVVLGSLDVQTSLLGDLKIKGPATEPRLTGSLTSEPGGILIFNTSHSFNIKSGKVIYNNTEFSKPDLYLLADSRIESVDKNEYEVEMLAQGPLDSFQIGFSSQPPLQEEDIFSLIVMGTLSFRESSAFQEDIFGYTLDTAFLSRSLKPFRLLRRTVGLDINIPIEVGSAKEAFNLKQLSFKYRINPNLIAEAHRTFEEEPKINMKFQYKLNRNLSFSGQLEQREQSSLQDGNYVNDNILGVDLEYKLEF